MWRDHAGRWIATGVVWYLITGFQGSLQSFPAVQEVTHFNNWTIGHAHIASWASRIYCFRFNVACSALDHGRVLFSRRLVNYQYALVLAGLTDSSWC